MKKALVAAVLAVTCGCATRGTIAELGRPEFSGTIPAHVELTLVEPKVPGQFHAYPRGAGKGDYHAETRMEEAPHHVLVPDPRNPKAPPSDNIAFVMNAKPTGDTRLKLFSVIAWPLLSRDVVRFKEDGHPPGKPPILRQVTVDHPVPDREDFGLIVSFPAEKLAGCDNIGVSALLEFEDGWISIVDSAVLVPTGRPEGAPR